MDCKDRLVKVIESREADLHRMLGAVSASKKQVLEMDERKDIVNLVRRHRMLDAPAPFMPFFEPYDPVETTVESHHTSFTSIYSSNEKNPIMHFCAFSYRS